MDAIFIVRWIQKKYEKKSSCMYVLLTWKKHLKKFQKGDRVGHGKKVLIRSNDSSMNDLVR